RTGWTLSQREAYFAGLRRAEQKQGARDYYSVLKRVRDEVISSLNTNEVQFLARAGALSSAEVPSTRKASSGLHLKLVREWKLADFDLAQSLRGRSAENGREVFHAAQCSLCHRFGNEGGLVGPDLTSVASRFD